MSQTKKKQFLLVLVLFIIFSQSHAKCTNVSEITEILGNPLAFDEITIAIPSTINVNWALSDEKRVSVIKGMRRMLTELAGGTTSIDSTGTYISTRNSEHIEEKITLIVVSMELNPEKLQEIKAMAQWLAATLEQESIFVKVNGAAFLIEK